MNQLKKEVLAAAFVPDCPEFVPDVDCAPDSWAEGLCALSLASLLIPVVFNPCGDIF